MVRRRGMVLFVVAVVVAMLSLAGLSYVTVLYTENQAVHVHGDQLEVECLVASGAEAVKAFASLSTAQREAFGGDYDNPELFQGVAVLDESLDGRQGRFSVISPRIDGGEITGIRFGLQNESARLSLAVLPEWDEMSPGAGRRALMALPGMTESIADAILDWVNADDSPRQSGAEADHYSALGVPYGPRNTVPTSLEELLLVRDVTREMLFGADANCNHRLDPSEVASRSSGGAGLPWASLLTVYSAERNTDPNGRPRVNLNAPDLAALGHELAGVLNQQPWVNFIIAYRQYGAYLGSDLPRRANSTGGNDSARPEVEIKSAAEISVDLSRPARYPIRSVLDLFGVWVAMEEKGDRTQTVFVESPFPQDPQAMRQHLPAILDWITVDDQPILRGRINVNQAPRPVLAGVPGLDDVAVEQIIHARASGGDFQDPVWRHPTWLWTEGVVELERLKQVLPFLTAGGEVYRAQVAGYFDTPGPSGRAEVVIDATHRPPRQIYWKDLRLLGLGYTPEELGGAAAGDQPRSSTDIADFGR